MKDLTMNRVDDSARERKVKDATQRRGPQRKRRKLFNFDAIRRRQIERHARYVQIGDTDDRDRWLIAWVWHNGQSTDPVCALKFAAPKMGCTLTEADARELVDQAHETRRRRSADNLARWLGVKFEDREALRITTIGSTDVNKRGRRKLRKEKDRAYQERKRRARGARPQSESLSKTQPWKGLGMSRRTWERHRNKARDATSSAAPIVDSDYQSIRARTRTPTYGFADDGARLGALCGEGPERHGESGVSGEILPPLLRICG